MLAYATAVTGLVLAGIGGLWLVWQAATVDWPEVGC